MISKVFVLYVYYRIRKRLKSECECKSKISLRVVSGPESKRFEPFGLLSTHCQPFHLRFSVDCIDLKPHCSKSGIIFFRNVYARRIVAVIVWLLVQAMCN